MKAFDMLQSFTGNLFSDDSSSSDHPRPLEIIAYGCSEQIKSRENTFELVICTKDGFSLILNILY